MFEEQAGRNPAAPALTCGRTSLTYGELNAAANRFAHLLASEGVGAGALVGVCLDRSPELLVSILGILKSGAAYVPLDPTYPAARLHGSVAQLPMLKLVVASPRTRGLVEQDGVDVLDTEEIAARSAGRPSADPDTAIDPLSPCYVVFTSGSTGTPKAAAVTHEGWFNLLSWLAEEFALDYRSSNLVISSFGFDITQRSLLIPLFTGATLHLLPSRRFDAMLAHRLLGELSIRTVHCAPSTLYLLLERDTAALGSLETVFVGGEPLVVGRVAQWATSVADHCRIVNLYGVAECSDVSTAHVLRDYPRYAAQGVPAGTAIHNTEIHLLSPDLAPLAPGETGEICIAGRGLGAGYLNADRLNQERYPVVDGVLLYRTGDLGRIEAGELLFVGRADSQVKVRGMRIDLGDVESAVRALDGVTDAAVVTGPKDGLVAYIVPRAGAEPDERALWARLSAVLPAQMVPQRFVPVPAFPLSPNGKVDRAALTRAADTRKSP
ncbi:amino acid adenylation domain-containing protein [Kitasatospora sp. MAA4]|uniref:amino acid adenylation domain-containing protein n=1 Tax=Kitasatospora sp. MAA4 TaxID=3035093 RepID=UPI002474082D|nr:amino acid adenylation domain-containing protein [Kitasatospora sp. MAA4]